MSITQEWQGKIVYWYYSGAVSAADIIAAGEEYYKSPFFSQPHAQIHDMLNVESFQLSIDDIKTLAKLDIAAAKVNPMIKVALVAKDETLAALSQLYGMEIESSESPWESCTFETIENAKHWLGMD